MNDVLYLAWRYLAYNRFKTGILIASITLIVYLPIGLRVIVDQSAAELTARAEATPLLVGAAGSPLELVLNSLYFETETPKLTQFGESQRLEASGLAEAIPLYVRFRARGQPIVGTTIEYFEFRKLRFRVGRPMAVLGECVVGASAAEALQVAVGDKIISSPESVFDLTGVYPLKMTVVGVLEPAFSPDDEGIFVDLKTAWVIEGLVHGHQDLEAPEAASGVLRRDDEVITANASVVQYNEITPDNIDSFHLHGDLSSYPLSAVIANPRDAKSGTILMGRFEGGDERSQIVQPIEVMNHLLDTVLRIQGFVVAAILVVAVATMATAALVFMLSLRLRRVEIATLIKIGGSKHRIGAILVSEVVAVLTTSALLAAGLTLLTSRFGSELIRTLLLS
ncbi:MAG: ABC transporter permease [Acidobacteriota bacterium]